MLIFRWATGQTLVIWFLLAVTVSGLLAYVQNFDDLLTIARDPISTTGAIVSTDCKNHALVQYRYDVNGKMLFGKFNVTDLETTLSASNGPQRSGKVVSREGFEPSTHGLKGRCSTN